MFLYKQRQFLTLSSILNLTQLFNINLLLRYIFILDYLYIYNPCFLQHVIRTAPIESPTGPRRDTPLPRSMLNRSTRHTNNNSKPTLLYYSYSKVYRTNPSQGPYQNLQYRSLLKSSPSPQPPGQSISSYSQSTPIRTYLFTLNLRDS